MLIFESVLKTVFIAPATFKLPFKKKSPVNGSDSEAIGSVAESGYPSVGVVW
jgi:hypothetical protein